MFHAQTRERAERVHRDGTEGESPVVGGGGGSLNAKASLAVRMRTAVNASQPDERFRQVGHLARGLSLARTKLSMQAADLADEQKRERAQLRKLLLFHPSAPCRTYWDVLLAVFVIYSIIVVPMRICFEVRAPQRRPRRHPPLRCTLHEGQSPLLKRTLRPECPTDAPLWFRASLPACVPPALRAER